DPALVDQDATSGPPRAHLRITQSVADVPANGQDDDVVGVDAARKRRGRASCEAPTAAATSEALPAEPRRAILRHALRATPRARHRHVLLCSAYPPHSPAREPFHHVWLQTSGFRPTRAEALKDCQATATLTVTFGGARRCGCVL